MGGVGRGGIGRMRRLRLGRSCWMCEVGRLIVGLEGGLLGVGKVEGEEVVLLG